FYTEQIGVVTEHLLSSNFSLTEVRILYEIAHRDAPTAATIAADLRLDRGYMSRILQRLQRQKIIERTTSRKDARVSLLSMTAKGRRAFRTLDTRAHEEVAELLRAETLAHQPPLLGPLRV